MDALSPSHPSPSTHPSIEAVSAVDIRPYSATYAEEEMVLLPGTELEVVGAVRLAADLVEVQLREVAVPFTMVP